MEHSPSKISELVITHKDIDFSVKTVEKLKRCLLSQIDIAAGALCESPATLKSALENGLARLGGYQSENGKRWIYVHLNNHNYVIPYVKYH